MDAPATPIVNAHDKSDGTKPPVKSLVDAFLELEPGKDKSAFFHANPSLAFIFNGVHFPKT
jgi:hypothetical protein